MKKAITLFFMFLSAYWALAHPMPNTLIDLHVSPNKLVFEINIPLFDVETATGIRFDTTFSESSSKLLMQPALDNYFTQHLKVQSSNGQFWPAKVQSTKLVKTTDPFIGTFTELLVVIHVIPDTNSSTRYFVLHYDAIIHQIVTHKALLNIKQDWEGGIHESSKHIAVIKTDIRTNQIFPVSVTLGEGSTWQGITSMFTLGVWHILEGTDHLLFICLLLIVAPITIMNRRWSGYGGSRYSLVRLLKIVTFFTIGHSMTLALCSLGIIGFSSRWIEVLVAFFILISGIHALSPLFYGRELVIACAFGLIHGMAFSDTLRHLHLDKAQLLYSILSFNIGIEAVQVCIIALTTPLLFWLSKQHYYDKIRMTVAILSMIAAFYWMYERILL